MAEGAQEDPETTVQPVDRVGDFNSLAVPRKGGDDSDHLVMGDPFQFQ